MNKLHHSSSSQGRETGAFGLEVLVNNGGVGRFAKVARLTVEEWDKMIQISQRGALPGWCPAPPPLAQLASKFVLNGFGEALLSDERRNGVGFGTNAAADFGLGFNQEPSQMSGNRDTHRRRKRVRERTLVHESEAVV